jgi:hypothetical protein
MVAQQPVGQRYVALVPGLPLIGLVATHEQDRLAVGIEGEKDPKVATSGANLLHIVVLGALDPLHIWKAERGALLPQ